MIIQSILQRDFLSISQILKGIICFFLLYVIYKFLQIKITRLMADKENKIISEEKLYLNSKKQIFKYLRFSFFIMISILFTNLNEFVSEINYAVEVNSLDALSIKSEDKTNWVRLSSNLPSQIEYNDMKIDERLEVLKMIVEYELNYLGVDKEIRVIYEEYENEIDGGYYSDNKKTISLKKEILESEDNLKEIIKILLHECYHAYQCECIRNINTSRVYRCDYNLRDIKKIIIWKYEIENYTSTEEHFDDYRKQTVESDADKYVDDTILKYEEYINQ